ncbi:MAG: glycine cleavage system H protein [Leptospiraceae bacterium]|nr:MAG: glycine cleavage system H protein [Leptospiraceae bacterium]
MSLVLEDLKYSKQHEWVKIEGDIAIIGITDFAQHSLGDIVYLETKDIGEKVEAGESCGTIESVKAAEDIYSPVSGTITEKNEEVINSPEKINQDPYGSWIIKLKEINKEDLNQLMSAEEYKKYIETLEQEE